MVILCNNYWSRMIACCILTIWKYFLSSKMRHFSSGVSSASKRSVYIRWSLNNKVDNICSLVQISGSTRWSSSTTTTAPRPPTSTPAATLLSTFSQSQRFVTRPRWPLQPSQAIEIICRISIYRFNYEAIQSFFIKLSHLHTVLTSKWPNIQ